jgi:hypothetical protein
VLDRNEMLPPDMVVSALSDFLLPPLHRSLYPRLQRNYLTIRERAGNPSR